MAIAYFIPDQAKLLAGQRFSRGSNNSRTSSNSEPSSRLQQNNSANEATPVNDTINRGYGTTINITVPSFNNATQEPLGCWDFLTQVFCHALRFYHESSQLQPTVIQISVNFNSQTAATATTTTSADAAATTNNQQTPTAEAIPLSTTTVGDQKQRKFSKRKN